MRSLSSLFIVLFLAGCQTTIPPFIDESELPHLERAEFLRIRELEDKVLRDYDARQESLESYKNMKVELAAAKEKGDDGKVSLLKEEMDLQELVIEARLSAMKHSISELEAEKARALNDHQMLGDRPSLEEYRDYRDTLADEHRQKQEELEEKTRETHPTNGEGGKQ